MSTSWIDGIPSNEVVVREADGDPARVAERLLSYLVEAMDLQAASVLYLDPESALYTPIFVHPTDRHVHEFVDLTYDSGTIRPFLARPTPIVIPDIRSSRKYGTADIRLGDEEPMALWAMPIRYYETCLGILNCYLEPERGSTLSDTDSAGLVVVAEKLGEMKMYCSQRQRARYGRRAHALHDQESLESLLQVLIEDCVELSPADYGFVGLVDSDSGEVIVSDQHVVGWDAADEASLLRTGGCFPRGHGIVGRAVEAGEPVVVHHVHDERFKSDRYRQSWPDVVSNLCLPVFLGEPDGELPFAIVSLEARSFFVFSETDKDLLKEYLERAAETIRSLLQVKLAEARGAGWESLGKIITKAMRDQSQPEQTLHELAASLIEITQGISRQARVFVATLSPDTEDSAVEIHDISGSDLEFDAQKPIDITEGLVGRAIRTRKPVSIPADAYRSSSFKRIWRQPAQSNIALPIVDKGRAVGVINVEHSTEDRRRDKRLSELLTRCVNAAAPAISELWYARLRRGAMLKGQARPILQLKEGLKQAARYDFPALILGEPGTGKELAAKRLHFESRRRGARFVPFSCAEVTSDLIASALFGHKRGAFTGAHFDRTGVVRHAHGSTLFLDELGDLPLECQGMLLRMLQEGEIRPLGSDKVESVNVRVVAATNKNLKGMVEQDLFRQDLLDRLRMFEFWIPPLRDRMEDIDVLAEHFIDKHYAMFGFERRPKLSGRALRRLKEHDWPGNVRALEQVVIKAMLRMHMKSSHTLEPMHVEFPGSALQAHAERYQSDKAQQAVTKDEWIDELYAQGGYRVRAERSFDLTRGQADKLCPPEETRFHCNRARRHQPRVEFEGPGEQGA